MALTRKRKKDLKKLRHSAADLWAEQRRVLDQAGSVYRETGRQLGNLSREEVAPRVRTVYDDRVRPAYDATRSAVGEARHRVVHDVLPGVSASLASAVATLEHSKDPRVRAAVKQVQDASEKVGKKATRAYDAASKQATTAYRTVGAKYGFAKPPKKKSLGFGGWTLIVIGVVAVAGVAYAAWQTLRADDELWVLDESDDIEPTK